MRNNKNIPDLNFLTNLKKLIATDNTNIYNTSIQKLNLLELYIFRNSRITDLNFMTSLKILASGNSGITQSSIQNLNLLELNTGY